ncbi:hypothetical protein PAXINDRAFT_91623, partial [Paxillus involutus ATCC 200175]
MGPKVETKSEGNAGGNHTRSRTVTGTVTPASTSAVITPITTPTPAAPITASQPAYYIQHAPISVHTAKLDTRSFEKIQELDRGKNNWSDWSFAIKLVLNQHLVGGYLTGAVLAPNPLTEPGAYNNWTLNNIAVVSALCSRVSHEDQRLLEDVTDAKQAWGILRERHEKVGPIAQILLIQEVFAKRYTRGQRFSLTSSELSDLVRRIYRIGIPTEEVFLSIAMLNALSGELNTVQTQVASLLSSSTKDRPFTSADIRARLDTEQQLLDNEKARSADIALAVTHKHGNHNRGTEKTCSLCGKRGHTVDGCWQPGGGMAGRRDEVLAKIRADKLTRKGGSRTASGASTPSASSSTSGPPSVRYDNSGRTYIVDSVTGGAVFLASTAAPSSIPVTVSQMTPSTVSSTSEFAGLAHDSISPEFLRNLPEGDQFEFDALMAHLGELTTSVDWRRHSSPFDFANLGVTAPDQRTKTVINPAVELFFIDTGASVHISNQASDFYTLRPIPPRFVNGVGGSGICAVGIGNICL